MKTDEDESLERMGWQWLKVILEPTVAIVTPKPLVGWCVLQNFTNSNSTLPPFHTFPLTPLFPLNLTAVPASKHEY